MYFFFRYKINWLSVLVGTNQLTYGGQIYEVVAKFVHSSWDSGTIAHDIALLKLKDDIEFGSKVLPIPLNSRVIPPGTVLTLSGWGYTIYPKAVKPNDLQTIQLTSINLTKCKTQLLPDPVYDTEICTLSPPGKGSCMGDSGGPLVVRGQLAGIASWGRPCARGMPDVFTDVAQYTNWVNTIMNIFI